MTRSNKARKLAAEAGKLFDSLYESYGTSAPHEVEMARKALAQASDALLIAAHHLQEREQKEAEFQLAADRRPVQEDMWRHCK